MAPQRGAWIIEVMGNSEITSSGSNSLFCEFTKASKSRISETTPDGDFAFARWRHVVQNILKKYAANALFILKLTNHKCPFSRKFGFLGGGQTKTVPWVFAYHFVLHIRPR